MTDADAAWCCLQWASGVTQQQIATHLGYRGAPQVSLGISRFLKRYSPRARLVDPGPRHANLSIRRDERRALVKDAVAAFIHQREASATIISPSVGGP